MESVNKDTLAEAGKTVRDAVIDIKSKLSDVGKQAMDTTKKVVEEVSESSNEAIKTYTEEGKKQISNLESYVRENPLKTVLFSVAAGFFINRLIRN